MATRCVDGRLMLHEPQSDDPDFETDRGECPVCDGQGCEETSREQQMGAILADLRLPLKELIHHARNSGASGWDLQRLCDAWKLLTGEWL